MTEGCPVIPGPGVAEDVVTGGGPVTGVCAEEDPPAAALVDSVVAEDGGEVLTMIGIDDVEVEPVSGPAVTGVVVGVSGPTVTGVVVGVLTVTTPGVVGVVGVMDSVETLVGDLVSGLADVDSF